MPRQSKKTYKSKSKPKAKAKTYTATPNMQMLKQIRNMEIRHPFDALSKEEKMLYKLSRNTIDLSIGTLEEYQALQ